ncbi:hypothetical protein XOC_0230 [Xanthomonas oryzae pv. oryzicola BLS256]|uniref:Uncharacterized protein n=2 Tax=Xanthomonas oryzae TaxID=347 RepID=A0A0K0GRF7_XANOP|nr:hypothetical protein PXO_05784 [Xanthomonas oryzae pv. oryzae PXO99A]AEQ94477.1 hypothetical protein XOC_0230 [Xanthomonas oryzae pv. oryzicola BLS256]QEO99743.1 hypothetical protein XOCgx_4756 [Xanthomonas oryzae pv. oryzicola]
MRPPLYCRRLRALGIPAFAGWHAYRDQQSYIYQWAIDR